MASGLSRRQRPAFRFRSAASRVVDYSLVKRGWRPNGHVDGAVGYAGLGSQAAELVELARYETLPRASNCYARDTI